MDAEEHLEMRLELAKTKIKRLERKVTAVGEQVGDMQGLISSILPLLDREGGAHPPGG